MRPLLPVGYKATADAYRSAVERLAANDLTSHYREGLDYFHQVFASRLKQTLAGLSGGLWDLGEFCPYAAGSDVDFMSHIVNAIATEGDVSVFPGDWYGFRAGASFPQRVRFAETGTGKLACLCVPSVRNGHLTAPMIEFLAGAETCLLNINLYPTLVPAERKEIASWLKPLLHKSIISISFSRGFGLTASQLGVILVHPENPLRRRFEKQWNWFTYFHNAIAARAFMNLDLAKIQAIDEERREWTRTWLETRGLPVVESGSYYVKSFTLNDGVPERFAPLVRDNLLRLCLKPPIS